MLLIQEDLFNWMLYQYIQFWDSNAQNIKNTDSHPKYQRSRVCIFKQRTCMYNMRIHLCHFVDTHINNAYFIQKKEE